MLHQMIAEGEKQFANILLSITTYGYDVVLEATKKMLKAGCANEVTILNAIGHLVDKPLPKEINASNKLILTSEPVANCSQYDALLEG